MSKPKPLEITWKEDENNSESEWNLYIEHLLCAWVSRYVSNLLLQHKCSNWLLISIYFNVRGLLQINKANKQRIKDLNLEVDRRIIQTVYGTKNIFSYTFKYVLMLIMKDIVFKMTVRVWRDCTIDKVLVLYVPTSVHFPGLTSLHNIITYDIITTSRIIPEHCHVWSPCPN